ncbi:MAG: hypothetical protein C0483_14250 [Pirellula sp.]|nr:hypothetical protein [Pirellula sp.]
MVGSPMNEIATPDTRSGAEGGASAIRAGGMQGAACERTPPSIGEGVDIHRTPVADGRNAKLLQTIVDSLSDGLVAVDLEGHFIQFNPSGAAILGQGATDAPAEKWPKQYGLYLADMATPFPHEELPLLKALRGIKSRDVEMYMRSDEQAEGRWLKVTGAPVQDERGEITGGVVLFRDETETKLAQQALEAERQYLRHLIRRQDRDRQLTSYDLHDGVVQLVTGALLHLEAYRNKHSHPDQAGDETIATVTHLLRDALDESRRLIGGLQPTALDEHGVIGAIEYLISQHVEQHGLQIDFTHDLGDVRLPSIVEATVFRIVQEALHNVVRHAETRRAAVTIRRRDGEIILTIRDWGCGFRLEERNRRRYGLRGMQERSRLLNGTVRIESGPGRGTLIEVNLPTDSTQNDAEESE